MLGVKLVGGLGVVWGVCWIWPLMFPEVVGRVVDGAAIENGVAGAQGWRGG